MKEIKLAMTVRAENTFTAIANIFIGDNENLNIGRGII